MQWEELRYILAIWRAGTLSGAAEALGVARTTVGRKLSEAEDHIGARLFDRTPQGLLATEAGEELARAAERMEAEALLALARVRGRDAELEGALRVSTVDFIYDKHIALFTSFMARYPRVALTVSTTHSPLSLRHGEADVVLRISAAPAAELYGRPLCPITFALYASRALIEQVGSEQPGALPWLLSAREDEDGGLRDWLAMHAPEARIAMYFEGYGALKSALLAGVGAHFLPRLDGDNEPGLTRIGPELEASPQRLWALTLPELRTNVRVRAFLDHVYEAFTSSET